MGKLVNRSTPRADRAAAPSVVLLSRGRLSRRMPCSSGECASAIGLSPFLAPNSNNHITAGSQPTTSQSTTNHPKRQLDVLREHRSYCPYAVKSTPVLLTLIPTHLTRDAPHRFFQAHRHSFLRVLPLMPASDRCLRN
ncbi:hypothetical protein JB92DRAFT_2889433 [Gautieria morchelliformis]|nr:hypothetical protein JB92DRAFT_2889433 [Gautieria morchelliformis]